MQQSSNRGNVARLAIAQALSMTTMNVNIINTALAGIFVDGETWPAAGFYRRGVDRGNRCLFAGYGHYN